MYGLVPLSSQCGYALIQYSSLLTYLFGLTFGVSLIVTVSGTVLYTWILRYKKYRFYALKVAHSGGISALITGIGFGTILVLIRIGHLPEFTDCLDPRYL